MVLIPGFKNRYCAPCFNCLSNISLEVAFSGIPQLYLRTLVHSENFAEEDPTLPQVFAMLTRQVSPDASLNNLGIELLRYEVGFRIIVFSQSTRFLPSKKPTGNTLNQAG
jgi:hypothetical protein